MLGLGVALSTGHERGQSATGQLRKVAGPPSGLSHGRVRDLFRYAAAATITAATLSIGAAGAGASTVGADSVGKAQSPGIALHVPRDGRLDGDGFALDVTGYRFAYAVGFGPSSKDAGPGQVLLVFGLSGSASAVQAQLVVDGQGTTLPSVSTPNASTPAYFLASVPVSSTDVALEASAGGFSQSFSFTKGMREGAQPTVLYRAQGQWREVDPIRRGITSVATPDNNPTDDVPGSVVNVNITAATLTYFLPSTGGTPGNPAKAWLVMSGSAPPLVAPEATNCSTRRHCPARPSPSPCPAKSRSPPWSPARVALPTRAATAANGACSGATTPGKSRPP